jgi:threonine synthase
VKDGFQKFLKKELKLLKFYSTKNKKNVVSFSEAVGQGLASDGGLFVPQSFPKFEMKDFKDDSIQNVASKIFSEFFKDEILFDKKESEISKKAFNFKIPLIYLNNDTAVLELFHGPTAAFKDVGARFLAECLKVVAGSDEKKYTILVATSGDTGGAVAAAFNLAKNFEVFVLYPKGKVSPLQEKQLTCWGSNIHALSVDGNFDDCQRMVKSAFLSSWWKKNKNLTSANSINIARILPQAIYYAASSLWYLKKNGFWPGFIIPSGNLGNGMAALWAKQMGFPIREIVFATNENKSIVDYVSGNPWKPNRTKITLANAMDVGNPSNIERLFNLYSNQKEFKGIVNAQSVSDHEIKETISLGQEKWNQIWCPHTATAAYVRESLSSPHWIIVSTAHPAKFSEVVTPLIQNKLEFPTNLKDLYSKKSNFIEIKATDEALIKAVLNFEK